MAKCSATVTRVAATHPCSATTFERQHHLRHSWPLREWMCDTLAILARYPKIREIPAPIKIKSALPPPQKKPRIPPPLKRGILWTRRFSCRKKAKTPGAHKIGTPISGPRIADKYFTDTRMFLTKTSEKRCDRVCATLCSAAGGTCTGLPLSMASDCLNSP